MTLDEALAKLRAAKPLLDRYGVRRVGVFGSTARGEAGPDSDVDVLVEFLPATLPGVRLLPAGTGPDGPVRPARRSGHP
jgi:predicted nucleotidyltransferase